MQSSFEAFGLILAQLQQLFCAVPVRSGILANEFAHHVGNDDPIRQESNDVSRALAELIGEQLQTKSPFAVANALFWAAAKVAASAADDCEEEEDNNEEEFVGPAVVN